MDDASEIQEIPRIPVPKREKKEGVKYWYAEDAIWYEDEDDGPEIPKDAVYGGLFDPDAPKRMAKEIHAISGVNKELLSEGDK